MWRAANLLSDVCNVLRAALVTLSSELDEVLPAETLILQQLTKGRAGMCIAVLQRTHVEVRVNVDNSNAPNRGEIGRCAGPDPFAWSSRAAPFGND